MTISEAITLYSNLERSINILTQPPKVMLAIVRNRKKLKQAVAEYEAARLLLIDRYGRKDEHGNLIIEDDSYVMEDAKAYNKAYAELVDQPAEVELTMFKVEDMDPDSINGRMMEILEPMIE